MYTGEFVLFVAILILSFFIRDRPCFSLQNSLMISFTVALGDSLHANDSFVLRLDS